MLVSCNKGCKNNVTTDASLDVDSNEAICNYCGDVIENITSYAKNAMKSNRDIVKKAKGTAFSFTCVTCKNEKQVVSENGKLIGVNCSNQSGCKFNVSEYMKRAIELYSHKDESDK